MALPQKLSRRERQMMDVIYRTGEASAAEVREGMTDPPSYSAVRATLRILEEKGVGRQCDPRGGGVDVRASEEGR